jgi:hypothetical protein
MLYRSTDRLCRRGAPVKNLSHSASFEPLDKDAPSKPGTKHLVSEWNDLPTDAQRRLFEHAASGKSHDAALLKARIARFLQNHKDDWAAR